MMNPEQIAAMRADAEAGTPGPWKPDESVVFIGKTGAIKADGRPNWGGFDLRGTPNAALDARVPDMEATIIAQAAEIERLKSGIPWRDGPPPEEWRDGRQVLVWAKNAHHVCWGAGSWHVVNGSGAQIVQSMITHHAAIDKPGETG